MAEEDGISGGLGTRALSGVEEKGAGTQRAELTHSGSQSET